MSSTVDRDAPYAKDPFAISWAESVCRDLDRRIARLVIALDLMPAGGPEALPQVLQQLPPPSPGQSGHERRAWDELRGLVFLRDTVIQRCVDRLGPVTTGAVLLEIEAELAQQGFAPGADGMNLRELLGTRPELS